MGWQFDIFPDLRYNGANLSGFVVAVSASEVHVKQVVLPGFESLEEEEPEVLVIGPKRIFDASLLPDAPKQQAFGGAYMIYVLFPDRESWERGIHCLSLGHRGTLPSSAKKATLAAVRRLLDGKTLLEIWEQALNEGR